MPETSQHNFFPKHLSASKWLTGFQSWNDRLVAFIFMFGQYSNYSVSFCQERCKAPIKKFPWVPRLTCFGNEELNALKASEVYYPSKADVGPRQLKKTILLFNLFDNELPIGCTTMRKVILPDTSRQYVFEQYQ